MQRLMTATLLATSLLITTSCSTIRMRLDAKVEADNGEKGQVTYENSYDLGSIPTLCALTGIFFGGACWFYLTYPNVVHMDAVRNDAEEHLTEKFGDVDYLLKKVKVDSKGWGEREEEFTFTPAAASPAR